MAISWARTTARCFGAVAAMAMAVLAVGAAPAVESDICENRSGAELIRCIEAAARSPATAAAQTPKTVAPPTAPPGAAAPAPDAKSKARQAEKPAAASAANTLTPRAEPQDCAGQGGETLRRCLAAGGRLGAGTTAEDSPTHSRPEPARHDGCEGKSGEALRLCVEAQSRSGAAARTPSRVIPCTGYSASDQPLCLHRNSAIVECRNRSRYPDFDVCLRSHMAHAPEPPRADCSTLSTRARAHCEARNRVYSTCTADRLGYFDCLGRQLGPDAVLMRR